MPAIDVFRQDTWSRQDLSLPEDCTALGPKRYRDHAICIGYALTTPHSIVGLDGDGEPHNGVSGAIAGDGQTHGQPPMQTPQRTTQVVRN